MKKEKVRVISPIGAALIKLGLNILNNSLVERIPVKEIQEDIRMLLQPIKNSINVLSDKDPNNIEQIKEVWLNFVKSNEFNETWEQRVMQAVNLIEDKPAKDFVARIVVPCFATIRSLYDNNPNNLDQIRQAWTVFMTEKENIIALLAFFIKDEAIRTEVATIVDNIHDTLAEILSEVIQ